MVTLSPEQYNALRDAQEELLKTQQNVQKLMRLLGLDSDKPYTVVVQVEELKVAE